MNTTQNEQTSQAPPPPFFIPPLQYQPTLPDEEDVDMPLPPFPPQALPIHRTSVDMTCIDPFGMDYITDLETGAWKPFVSLVFVRNSRPEDLLKQQSFVEKILAQGNPVGFTPTRVSDIEVHHELGWLTGVTRGKCLYYTRHRSEDPHDCEELECDEFCVKLTNYTKLLIKYKTPRKNEFTKEEYTQLHDFFVRVFNVMNLAFHQRSIATLQEYFSRVPNWLERFQEKFEAAKRGEEVEAVEEDKDVLEENTAVTSLAIITKEMEKLGRPIPSQICQHVVLKYFQTLLRMTAIPSILLAIPRGCVNPYAQYVESFIKDVDVYEMLYTCRSGIPKLTTTSAAAAAGSLDEAEPSFLDMFRDKDEENIFCLATRRCTMDELVTVGDAKVPFDEIASTNNKEAAKMAMRVVFDMFFSESAVEMHVTRLNQLTGYEDMFTGEQVALTADAFKALFAVYTDLKTSSTNFESVDDKCLVNLAYLSECIGDRQMVFQIIRYFLSYRFEYMTRLWSMEMPKVKEDLQLPYYFRTAVQWEDIVESNYGWDQNGRDA
jgi:hypothetical protein